MIRPDKLRQLSLPEEAQCGLAEVLIDEKLSEVWEPGLCVNIPCDPQWSLRVIGALLRGYKGHGWQVEHTHVNVGAERVRVLSFQAA